MKLCSWLGIAISIAGGFGIALYIAAPLTALLLVRVVIDSCSVDVSLSAWLVVYGIADLLTIVIVILAIISASQRHNIIRPGRLIIYATLWVAHLAWSILGISLLQTLDCEPPQKLVSMTIAALAFEAIALVLAPIALLVGRLSFCYSRI